MDINNFEFVKFSKQSIEISFGFYLSFFFFFGGGGLGKGEVKREMG